MCEPVSIMTALSVATTAAGIVTQVKAAKAQERAIAAQLAQSETEINDKATAEINERQRAARREQARIKVAAGQAGLQLGGSIDALLADSMMQAGLSEEALRDNQENQLRSVRSEANAAYSRVNKPSLLSAGLQLAGAGVSGYAAGLGIKAARSKSIADAASAVT